MRITPYPQVDEFLQQARPLLEQEEAVNNLILGLALRLRQEPEAINGSPYLATVADDEGLVLVALMIPGHKLLLYTPRPGHPAHAEELLARHLYASERPVTAMMSDGRTARSFVRAWTTLTGDAYRQTLRQCLYRLDRVVFPATCRGRLRAATRSDFSLVLRWAYNFHKEVLPGTQYLSKVHDRVRRRIDRQEIYLWQDEQGQPLSMAGKTRSTTHGICVNLVYTPPHRRGQGHASACVAHLSQLLLDSGFQFCVLFADLANPTANHIYQAIGYRALIEFEDYKLG